MNSKWLIGLAVVTIVLVGLAISGMERNQPAPRQEPAPLLSGLDTAVNDVEQVRLVVGGEEVVATLRRQDDAAWVVEERQDYPADLEAVRELLIGLSQARRVEKKTADPERYARLGVRDIGDTDATGVEIRIQLPERDLAVILGDQAAEQEGTYARIAGETQTWLIDRTFNLDDEAGGWLAPEIINLEPTSIRRLEIALPDGEPFAIERITPESVWTISPNPDAREPAYPDALQQPARAVVDLDLEDVRPADEVTVPETTRRMVVTTFDGLTVIANSWQDADDNLWLMLEAGAVAPGAAGDPETTTPDSTVLTTGQGVDAEPSDTDVQAERLNSRWRGWVYQVPGYRKVQWTAGMDDVLAPLDPAVEAIGPAAGAPKVTPVGEEPAVDDTGADDTEAAEPTSPPSLPDAPDAEMPADSPEPDTMVPADSPAEDDTAAPAAQ